MFLITCFLVVILLIVSFEDAKTYRIPDIFIIALAMLYLAERLWQDRAMQNNNGMDALIFYPLLSSLVSFFCFALLKYFGDRYTKKTSLGWGDIKLVCVLSLWLDYTHLPTFYLLVGGSVVCQYLLFYRIKKTYRCHMALAPHMSLWFCILHFHNYYW